MAPSSLASTLFGDANKWITHQPDYPGLINQYGGAVGTNAAATRIGYPALANCSPILLCLTYANDPDHINVTHSPTIYLTDPTSHSPLDDSLIILVGDNLDNATALALHGESFQHTGDVRCKTTAIIVGAAGHGADPLSSARGLIAPQRGTASSSAHAKPSCSTP